MPRPGQRAGFSKYQPLANYLAAASDDVLQRTLADIEAILGFALPESAYDDHSFWTRPPSRVARTLAAVGWQAQLRPHEEAVMFTRILPATP